MHNEIPRYNSTGYSSIHGSSDEKDYVEGVGVGGGGVWLPWTCIMMVWWGAPRTDVIQTQPYRPSLGSQSVVHTVEGHPGGTLSHTVGLLTVFHSQKKDELEPETGDPARLPAQLAILWAQRN